MKRRSNVTSGQLRGHANGAYSINGRFISKQRALKLIQEHQKALHFTPEARSRYKLPAKFSQDHAETTVKRGINVATAQLRKFQKRGFGKAKTKNFPKHYGQPMRHKRWKADLDFAALSKKLKKYKGLKANLVVTMKVGGEEITRMSRTTGTDEPGLLLELMNNLLERYVDTSNKSKPKIPQIKDVQLEIWGSYKEWKGRR